MLLHELGDVDNDVAELGAVIVLVPVVVELAVESQHVTGLNGVAMRSFQLIKSLKAERDPVDMEVPVLDEHDPVEMEVPALVDEGPDVDDEALSRLTIF